MKKYLFLFFLIFSNLYADEPKIISTVDIKKDLDKLIKREKVVKIALSYLGKRYIRGGDKSAEGFDCSGFTQFVFSKINIKIPRTVSAQYYSVVKTYKILKKGDVVFFTIKLNGIPDHVGIYIGNGEFIHSPSTGKYVRIDSLNKKYWKLRFISSGTFIY